MKYYFLTGSSKGIGKGLTERILKEKNSFVFGISRNNNISNKNFKHIELDLSDISSLKSNIKNIFKDLESPERIVLINNAGVLGEVGYLGEIESESIENLFNVNVIAPSILMNEFIRKYKEINTDKLIINLSSGAGKRAIDGWTGYCSSKSALDMFSEIVSIEQNIRKNNFKIFSIAPGVVESQMQEQIRNTNEKDFSTVQRFHEMKENNFLDTPESVAEKLLYVIENSNKYNQTLLDIRNL